MIMRGRSEEMALCSLVISKDNCWEVMNELGKSATLHFLDLNQREPAFSRIYASSIKRCDEAERKALYCGPTLTAKIDS